MKLIESRTRTLERENKALKRQVGELQAEVQALRERYRRSWLHTRSHRSSVSAKTVETEFSSPLSSTKSYLCPTKASASRSATVDEQSTGAPETPIVGKGLLYNDDLEGIEQANFLKHTEASSRKARTQQLNRGWGEDRNQSSRLDDAEKSWFADSHSDYKEAASEDDRRSCTKCGWIDRSAEYTSDDSLESRSRLRDDSFYSRSASACFVPFRLQTRLLKAALRLAQETLWTALREHWPQIQRSRYLQGPEQVKFGREELSGAFGDEEYPREANEMCGQPRGTVIHCVLDVAYLRNAVCHPGHHTPQELDRLIRRSQALAVILQDESRAFKVRKLRDQLQAETLKAFHEIKAYVGLASLPFAKSWPIYQQHFFHSMRLDTHCSWETEYPEVVKRAAREWKLKYIRPGEMDPRYLANVEKAKLLMRVTAHGRRASVSEVVCDQPAVDPGGSGNLPAESIEAHEQIEQPWRESGTTSVRNSERLDHTDGW
ncbi:hypothetical protein LTR37_021319 [Vermiconidia calcicola]|uniref:Uncharacterized protein n=1 Tax=Vermiconidia calcicola TaxID=1690605 RepID=A0ACC3M903_9PEZI|nr:hypothetical protein LTR37_021319 [Vermiconidia calcicola]